MRGYNIDSLTVAPTDDPTLSRMTVVTIGNDETIEQIIKQLKKLVDVVEVLDMTVGAHIEREMLLIKVNVESIESKAEIKRLSDIFRGKILDVTETTYTIEMTGGGEKLDAFLNVLKSERILEVVRSGVIGIGRGDNYLRLG